MLYGVHKHVRSENSFEFLNFILTTFRLNNTRNGYSLSGNHLSNVALHQLTAYLPWHPPIWIKLLNFNPLNEYCLHFILLRNECFWFALLLLFPSAFFGCAEDSVFEKMCECFLTFSTMKINTCCLKLYLLNFYHNNFDTHEILNHVSLQVSHFSSWKVKNSQVYFFLLFLQVSWNMLM